jgi:hypothetical protein
MNTESALLKIAEANNGVITTLAATNLNIKRGSILYLVKKGRLVKSSRGVYIMPEYLDDNFLNEQIRFKKGIYSLNTSLYLNGLSDRTPEKLDMSFPQTYNLSNPKKRGINCKNINDKYYKDGLIQIKTPYGNKVWVYCKERSLCEILQSKNNVDIQIITSAFKSYAIDSNKQLELLMDYAKKFNVENRVKAYMEVLL